MVVRRKPLSLLDSAVAIWYSSFSMEKGLAMRRHLRSCAQNPRYLIRQQELYWLLFWLQSNQINVYGRATQHIILYECSITHESHLSQAFNRVWGIYIDIFIILMVIMTE